MCTVDSLIGQNLEESGDLVRFDKTIGPMNSGAFTGYAYTEEFRVLGDRHKFFLSSDFLLGTVNYNGQSYFDYKMKYDVHGDNLLLRHGGVNGTQAIQLIKERVTKFEIEGHRFINLDVNYKMKTPVSGFLEVLFEGNNFSFLKKHKKYALKKVELESVYFEFKGLSEYFLVLNNGVNKIKSNKQITALFPNYRKQISDFTSKYKKIKKSDVQLYLESILSDLDKLIELKNEEGK
ncbi:hypothetical protein FB2170_06990 [Maribacter sp. HTCC2170]|nr:hypothetical protein FB2170_06990 [Maribacter sp. HTCC2170]